MLMLGQATMDSKLCFLLLLLSSSGELMGSDIIVFTSQPKNSEVCIGSSAEMSCSFVGTDTLPMWLINSAKYTSLHLPPKHKYNGHTLTVDNVFAVQNGTTYQCYFNRYSLNGTFYQVRSNTGRLNVLTTDACLQNMGPTNISRKEGEQNVFIPCPLSGLVLPVWKINQCFYELYQIPEEYTPAYGGIYIKTATRELNGTVFQCFTDSGHGFISEASSIGILTVEFTDTTHRKQVCPSSTSCISPEPTFTHIMERAHAENSYLYLDHQNMLFDEYNVSLTWKATDFDCSTFKIVFRKDCGYLNQLQPDESTYTASIPRFNFPVTVVDGLYKVDINIESLNHQGILCQMMKETVQINENAIPMERVMSSLKLSEIKFVNAINSTFYVVFPQRSTSSNQQDCFCPVVFHNEETCYKFDTCSCINNTVFSDSYIEICYKIEDVIQLVLKSLTNTMNNTLIHIFHGFYCDIHFIPPYRIYTHQFQIFIVLPEPPNVDVDENEGTICFYSNKVDGISLDKYEVTIYDRTGGGLHTFSKSGSNTEECIIVGGDIFQNEICAPFIVSTSAINAYGRSTTNVTTHPVTDANDTCSCLELNVDVNVTIVEADVKVYCVRMDYETALTIEIRVDQHTATATCSRESFEDMVHLQNLDCSKQYNLSVVWVSNNTSIHDECLLFERTFISFKCPVQRNVIILLAGTIPGAVVVILIMIVSLLIGCCWFMKIKKRKYQRLSMINSELTT